MSRHRAASALAALASAAAFISPAHAQVSRPEPGVAFPEEFRTPDGSLNNPSDPLLGAASTVFIRDTAPAYDDGSASPARAGLPSARVISNAVHAQTGPVPNPVGASDWVWAWGQFLDHDLTETPAAEPAEPLLIPVPPGDPSFGSAPGFIPFFRSAAAPGLSPRQQINEVSAFIDASQVYGSSDERALALRTLNGSGRLTISRGNFLPFNTAGLPNQPDTSDDFFLAGDPRANEQVALIAVHTLFVREHNHWADHFRQTNPELSGDELYEHARAMVTAIVQRITYEEFLPVLLGENTVRRYNGYDRRTDPTISNDFATAAFRVGHTMLSPTIRRVGPDLRTAAEGDIALADAFFAPEEIIRNGIDTVLRGLAFQEAQAVDRFVVDGVRNMLFGAPGDGGMDLAALNIQRGRDHGIGSYTDIRDAYGRRRLKDFDDMEADADTIAALASVYPTVDDIDPWTGLISETNREGALVSETARRLLRDQFLRLRTGDRLWYQRYLPKDLLNLVYDTTLADVIRRNTGIGNELPDNPFLAAAEPERCAADIDGNGVLEVLDVVRLVNAFTQHDPEADMDGDGVMTVGDVLGFLAAASEPICVG